jgi:hypothetical protein
MCCGRHIPFTRSVARDGQRCATPDGLEPAHGSPSHVQQGGDPRDHERASVPTAQRRSGRQLASGARRRSLLAAALAAILALALASVGLGDSAGPSGAPKPARSAAGAGMAPRSGQDAAWIARLHSSCGCDFPTAPPVGKR